MIPVLLKFDFNTPFTQALAYLVAAVATFYLGWSGYRGAPKGQEWLRALMFGGAGVGLSVWGLSYVLPKGAFLGQRGEGLPIHTYGLLLATGFISAVTMAGKLAEREWRGPEGVQRRDQIMDLAFWVLVSALVGSRLMFIVANWREYVADPRRFFSLEGGLVFYGGFLGALLASYLYARKVKLNFFRLADVAIPTVSLGQAFGRLGCFSAGCCWGGPAVHSPFGVQFPGGHLAHTLLGNVVGTPSLAFSSMAQDDRYIDLATGKISHSAGPGLVRISEWVLANQHTFPIFPTQLMESLGQLTLFLVFLWLRRYRRFHGQILGMWLMAYAVLRSTVELFRGDTERGTLHHFVDYLFGPAAGSRVPLEAWWNISLGQFISLCLFAVGAAILVRRRSSAGSGSGANPSTMVPQAAA